MLGGVITILIRTKHAQQQQGLIILALFHFLQTMPHEPRHDKTNKMSMRPAKTQISLGIRPV